MPDSPEAINEYSAMLTELMTEYPEYKEMTLEEITEDMGLEEGIDVDLMELEQGSEIPAAPGEEEDLMDDEEDLMMDDEAPLY